MFDNIKPLDQKWERRKRQLAIGIPLLFALAGYLYYEFKNFPEEQAVSHFMEALQKQNYEEAYRIWQPSNYYTFKNFSEDWGPEGVEGVITEFDILTSRSRGNGVLVDVAINRQKRIRLFVERDSKRLSFPP